MFKHRTISPLLIAVLAIALGTVVDAIVKGLAPDAGLHHLLAWRFLFGGLIAWTVFRIKGCPRPSIEAIRFHSMRGVLQLLGAALFFYAITQLPLAEATIIGFTAALMVPPVARLLLKEKISSIIFLAALLGFGGASLAVSGDPVIQVEDGSRTLGLIAAFMAALVYAFILVLLRMRAKTDDATTIAMFTNIVPAIVMLPVSLGVFGWPTWSDLPLFAVLGALGFAVWYLFTLAYARAPAQQLAPLEYTALIWSAILGAVFFQEYPGWQVWAGGVLIIAACLIVAFADRFRTRRKAGLPASDLPD